LPNFLENPGRTQQRDKKRGLLNIQRLHERCNPEVWRNTTELIELIREINGVMKKEASVIHDMRAIPKRGTNPVLARGVQRNLCYRSNITEEWMYDDIRAWLGFC
jgi:hypothetical protein